MGRGVDQVGDGVLVFEAGAGDPTATSTLGAELGDRRGLHVAGGAHGEDELLVVDQVLDVEVPGVVHELAAPRVGESASQLGQFVLEHATETGLVGEDRLEFGDHDDQLCEPFLEVGPTESGEADELHVEDVVRLDLREPEGVGHEALAGGGPVCGPTDEGDDVVDRTQRRKEALGDVRLRPGLFQAELAAPTQHLDLVDHIGVEEVSQVQRAGDAVDQRHGVDRERRLQWRPLEEVVQDHERRCIPLEGDDDAGHALCRLVVDVGDALDLATVHEIADLGHDLVGAGLVGKLRHDDAGAARAFLDVGPGSHANRAPPGAVGVGDPGPTEDQRPGREIGSGQMLHQVVGCGLRMVDEVQRGIDDLAQVVGRDVGGHADRDPLAAVDEQVRKPRREEFGFGELARVVVDEVDGVLVDAVEQGEGDGIESTFGVAGGSSRVVRRIAEVALRVHQGVPQAEVLGHAHEGVVDGLVAVRVVLAHDLAGHPCAFHGGAIGAGAEVVHAPEDPAVDGLEAVAGVGQGPGHDDGHGVVQEGLLHLLLDLDRFDRTPGGFLWLRVGHARRGPIWR